MTLKVNVVQKEPGIFTVLPAGSIDSNTYTILEEKLVPILPQSKVLIIDMKEVSYISSIGVGVIFKAKKALEKDNGTLLMIQLQPQIKKVFDIINALPSQNIIDNVEELDNYLSRMQQKEIEKQQSS